MINSINFGSNTRAYSRCDANSRYVSCYTSMFRNDIQWEKFAHYLISKYKNSDKVNIINAACSDGSEAYSLAISLMNSNKVNSDKFFPIKASDIDKQILDCGINGYIYFNYADIYELQSRGIGNDEYFSIYDKKVKRKIKANGYPGGELYSVGNLLKDKVEFSKNNIVDILENMEDDSENTVLLFRNAFPYLTESEKLQFLKLCTKKLGRGSMLVMGSFDKGQYGKDLKQFFESSGFIGQDLFYDAQVFEK